MPYSPEIHPQYSEAMTDAEFLRWLHLRLTRDFGDLSCFQHVSRVLTLSDRLADEERAAAEQALRIAQLEAAAEATRLREEAEARDAVARAAHRAKQEQEYRAAVSSRSAAVVSRIAADLATLKKDGKISSMSELAECIVSGGLRGVTVDWEVA